MKKIPILLMAVLVTAVILQIRAAAADYSFSANISGPVNISAGSEATYTVSVTNIDEEGSGLTAVDMAFSFDTDVFTYVSGSAAAVSPPAGWSEGINEGSSSSGSIHFSPSGTPPITADNAIGYQLRLIVKNTDKKSTALLITGLTGTGPATEEYIGTSAGFNVNLAPPLAISDQTLGGSLTVGEYYSASIVTTGGTGAKTFGITSGTLPAGLGLNISTGVISGTPSAANGSVTGITIIVTDTVNTTGVSAVITVPSVGTADPVLAISDQTLGGALTVGENYSASIVTTGGTGTKKFGITSGTLPAGLGLNTSTGVVSGTPSAAKDSVTNVTVKVTDTVNTVGVSAVITIPRIGKAGSDFNANAPTNLTATYGAVLSSVALPAGYSWTDGSVSVGNVGTNYFPAKFNDDPVNKQDAFGNIYVAVTAKPLTVTGAVANDRKYNGYRTISLTGVTLNGRKAGDTAADVSVDTALAFCTLPSANAGTYETADLSDLVLKGTKAANYTIAASADDVPLSITITRADKPDIAVQQLYFTCTQATSDNTFDVAELLPSDRGTTAYAAGPDGVYTLNISINSSGTVEFDTQKASSPVSEIISVEAEMCNYQTVTVQIKVNLTDLAVPTGTPTVKGTMVYGQKLSVLTIQVTMKDGTTVIPGTIAWDFPNTIPAAGTTQQPWTFTPSDNGTYSTQKGNTAVTVAKAVPLVMLSDKTAEHTGSAVTIDKPAVILVNSETYTGSITYKYYTDIACTKQTGTSEGASAAGGAPKNTGTYYVKASVTAFTNYTEAASNTAVLKITASDDKFTVTASAGKGGSVTPKQIFASAGGDVTVLVMPDDGYVVSDVKINGVSVGAVIKYIITDIQKDYTVTAEFVPEDGAQGPFAFIDIRRSDWFYDGVKFVFDEKLMQGVSSLKFDPQGIMTRAMLVTVLWRVEGSPDVQANASFPDVPANQWYSDAVLWAARNEIVYGYAGGGFGPGDFITREQMMAIFYRYSDYKGYDMTASDNLAAFRDAGDISGWALNAMKWAVGMNLIQGMTPTAVSPQGFATRAQTAVILTRFFN